jgi:hypothetical protein
MYTEGEKRGKRKISENGEDESMGDDILNDEVNSIHYIEAKRQCLKTSFSPPPF